MEITREKIIRDAREAKALALRLRDRKATASISKILAKLGDHSFTEQENEEIRQIAEDDAVPTALYRHLDCHGKLLYVGISLHLIARLSGHKSGSPWFTDITRIDVEWFGCRSDAIAAEEQAIKTEHPKHNVIHNRPAHASP